MWISGRTGGWGLRSEKHFQNGYIKVFREISPVCQGFWISHCHWYPINLHVPGLFLYLVLPFKYNVLNEITRICIGPVYTQGVGDREHLCTTCHMHYHHGQTEPNTYGPFRWPVNLTGMKRTWKLLTGPSWESNFIVPLPVNSHWNTEWVILTLYCRHQFIYYRRSWLQLRRVCREYYNSDA